MAGQGGEQEEDKPGRKRPDGEGADKPKGSRRRRRASGGSRGDMLLAISHPLRRRILRKLAERGEPTSPIQLADELGGPLGKVAYHVRVLWRLRTLSAARQQQVRRAVEHFYSSTIKNDPPIETLLEETRKEDEEEE
jgi:DNA-binding transcriptional ArsR family regulator